MKIKFHGAPHLKVYRADHVLGGKAIAAGEVVDLPDEQAGYLLTDFPESLFSAVSGDVQAAKAAHAAKLEESAEEEAADKRIRRAALKRPTKHSAAE
jgi:hypothetical protein